MTARKYDRDRFYDGVDDIYRECHGRDNKIIIGDMNVNIGREEEYRLTIGKYDLLDE